MMKFKKIISIAFLLLFVTETFGVYKYVHFCGSEKTSESFFIEKKDCCCADSEEADDCCTDETSVVQFQEENTVVPSGLAKSPENKIIDLPVLSSPVSLHLQTTHTFSAELNKISFYYDSGGTHLPSLCVFRI